VARDELGPSAAPPVWTSTQELRGVLEQVASEGAEAVAVIGGDGTARTALEILTPRGIPVIPLPGGTLNRLSRQVLGTAGLRQGLRAALDTGQVRPLCGARLGGHRFFVASGYGAAMQLQAVREAVRAGGLRAGLERLAALSPGLFGRPLVATAGQTDAQARLADGAVVAVGSLARSFGLLEPAGCLPAGTGSLQIGLARWDGWLEMLGLGPAASLGLWPRLARTQWLASDRVQLAFGAGDAPLPALLDGEAVVLDTPAQITFDPAAGLILAPPPGAGGPVR
jgi:diacylglycerol kinase family enzyme